MNDLVLFPAVETDITPLPSAAKAVKTLSMEQIMRGFFAPLAKNSRITIRHALRRVADDLGFTDTPLENVPWMKIDASVLQELVLRWNDGSMSNATIRIYMYAVRGLLRQCYVTQQIPLEQYALLKEVKAPRGVNRIGRGKFILERDRRALIRSCEDDERRVIGLRDLAMIALLFGAGVRRSEAAALQLGHLNLDEGTLRIKVKGGDLVEKYLAAWAIKHLRNWVAELQVQELTDGPVLRRVSKGGRALKNIAPDGIYQALEARSTMAGIPFVRPHDCRRSLATDLIRSHGLGVAKIALGHKSITTTAIYDMTDKDAMRNIFSEKTL